MTDTPDLFSAAGVELEDVPAPVKAKRARKSKPPTPAERATKVRAQAGRRGRRLGPTDERVRIGSPRDLHPRKLFGFPFSRNTPLLQQVISRLPHGYDDDAMDRTCASEAKKLKSKLVKSGLPKQLAQECARELVDAAYIERVTEAHKEAGVL